MKLRDILAQKVEQAMLGYNMGIPMGYTTTPSLLTDPITGNPIMEFNHSKLSNLVCGIQKGRYDLWGGLPGTGKTALVDDLYIHNPIKFLKEFPDYPMKLKIEYFNLEIPIGDKAMKYASRQIFEITGRLYSPNQLSGKKQRLSKELSMIIGTTYDYFDELEDYVKFDCSGLNPKYFYKRIMRAAEENGKIFYLDTSDVGGKVRPFTYEELKTERDRLKKEDKDDPWIFDHYVPNDPYLVYGFIVDHIGLTKYTSYKSKKEALDNLSGYAVDGRNHYNNFFCFVSQFNRGNEDMGRIKNSPDPMLSDFKDTGSTQEDANLVGATYNPFRHKQESHNGYQATYFSGFYRSVSILKNRDGADNIDIPYGFRGDIGQMRELPDLKALETNTIEGKARLKKIMDYYTSNR